MIWEIFLIIATALAAFVWYIRNIRWNYWKNKGVFQIPGSLPWEDIMMTKHLTDIKTEEYFKAEGQKVYGSYLLFRPVLNIRDPELVKHIMVKDFDSFVDRNASDISHMTESITDQVWSKQISLMEGDQWKDARSSFSPIFTSGKLKSMKPFIDANTLKLLECFHDRASKNNGTIDLKDLFGRFSMDTIASCAFGVDTNSFSSDPKALQFVNNASALFERGPFDVLKFMFLMLPHGGQILSKLGLSVMKDKETMFFYDVVMETLKMRKSQGKGASKRNDLIDLMLDIMKTDETKTIEPEEEEEQFEKDAKLMSHQSRRKREMDEMEIVASAFVILVAGYDTTSQVLCYSAYELARNPEAQRCLQEEIDAAYETSKDGKTLDYNTVQTLPYLDMVLHETLRLHPALGVIERVCTKDNYKVPGTDITLMNQDVVNIPAYGIHVDPNIFPEPKKFKPERFSKEEKAKRSPYTFLGFGQGPRSCLGMRFALLEAKAGLAAIVKEFEFQVCDKTVPEIKLDPKSVLSGNIGGLWVKAVKRV